MASLNTGGLFPQYGESRLCRGVPLYTIITHTHTHPPTCHVHTVHMYIHTCIHTYNVTVLTLVHLGRPHHQCHCCWNKIPFDMLLLQLQMPLPQRLQMLLLQQLQMPLLLPLLLLCKASDSGGHCAVMCACVCMHLRKTQKGERKCSHMESLNSITCLFLHPRLIGKTNNSLSILFCCSRPPPPTNS